MLSGLLKAFKRLVILLTAGSIVYTVVAYASAETPLINVSDTVAKEEIHVTHAVSNEDLQCLAENIYFEAGTESYAGKVAVALVTLTRVNDKRYPNGICEVVKEGPLYESWKTRNDANLPDEERVYFPRKHKCQFSWYCDGKSDKVRPGIGWDQAREVAYKVAVLGMYKGMVEESTHYHATYVSPAWRHDMTLIGRIDTHIFYRWDGSK